MNLHGIVCGAIGAVNPHVRATIRASAGYTTADDGTQQPAYTAACVVMAQVQSLTYRDLQQVDGLNLEGDARAIYLSGNWEGVLRPGKQGGDLIQIGKAVWLVVQTLEQWPDWTKVAAVRQMDAADGCCS